MNQAVERPWSLVTGGSSGIGEAVARSLAARGHNLILVARDESRLKAAAASLSQSFAVSTRVVACDLARPEGVADVVRELQESGIEVDVLVNNAGFGVHGRYETSSLPQSIDLVQVQLVASMQLTHFLLAAMKRRRRGYILNVASVYSFCPVPNQAVYSACKSFMLAFSHALRAELADTGVNITVLCPGVTRTRFRSRMGYPETAPAKGMSADAVASAALAGLFARRFLVIPGVGNQIFSRVSSMIPAKLATRIIARINRRRGLSASERPLESSPAE
jgi:short-subunit dehydrogenase